MSRPVERGPTRDAVYRAAVVGAAACALCDTLHELGHVAATALPGRGAVLAISSVGISTTTSNPTVALMGPLVNLLLAGVWVLATRSRLSANWRYAFWLFGTLNLFNGVAYLVYSAVLGSGDWATVFDAAFPSTVWRPITGVLGVVSYAGAVYGSSRVARALVADGVSSREQFERWCRAAYWAGGTLLVVASTLNPFGPLLILTSGVATGFGAMAGLLLVPALLGHSSGPGRPATGAVDFSRVWVIVCLLLCLAFVLILGRGWHFASASG